MANFKGPLDYNTVAERLVEFREKYPEGSLQQHDLQFIEFGGKSWVVYTAAAYRFPDDIKPGMGTAWEQVPGPTPYTRDSELQNAETSAWGRAIVAALASDTKKGIATAEDVAKATNIPIDWVALAKTKSLADEVRAVYARAKIAGTSDDVLQAIQEFGKSLVE